MAKGRPRVSALVPQLLAEEPVLPLDGPLTEAARKLESVLATWQRLAPSVEAFMDFVGTSLDTARKESRYTSRMSGEPMQPEAWSREVALDLIRLLQELSRTVQSLTRAIDDAARLRSFLAGGPDRRVELATLGDAQLLAIVMTFARERGLVAGEVGNGVGALPAPEGAA